MSLYSTLKNNDSNLSRWFDAKIKPEAAEKFVKRINDQLQYARRAIGNDTDWIVSSVAAQYLTNWHLAGEYSPEALKRSPAYLAAVNIMVHKWDMRIARGRVVMSEHGVDLTGVMNRLTRDGTLYPDKRPFYSVILALLDLSAKAFEIHPMLQPHLTGEYDQDTALLQRVQPVVNDLQLIQNQLRAMYPAPPYNVIPFPLFSGGNLVGGAHGYAIVDNRYVYLKTSAKKMPLEVLDLKMAVAHCLLDFADTYQLNELEWSFPRHGVAIKMPLSSVIRDIHTLRVEFRNFCLYGGMADSDAGLSDGEMLFDTSMDTDGVTLESLLDDAPPPISVQEIPVYDIVNLIRQVFESSFLDCTQCAALLEILLRMYLHPLHDQLESLVMMMHEEDDMITVTYLREFFANWFSDPALEDVTGYFRGIVYRIHGEVIDIDTLLPLTAVGQPIAVTLSRDYDLRDFEGFPAIPDDPMGAALAFINSTDEVSTLHHYLRRLSYGAINRSPIIILIACTELEQSGYLPQADIDRVMRLLNSDEPRTFDAAAFALLQHITVPLSAAYEMALLRSYFRNQTHDFTR